MWGVHAQLDYEVLPFAYFLLSGASEEIYLRASKILQKGLKAIPTEDGNNPGLLERANPDDADKDEVTLAAEEKEHDIAFGPKVFMGYVTAQYNAFIKTFNGKVQGSLFHYHQTINRCLKGKNLLSYLKLQDKTDKCKFLIQKLVALAFIKPEHIDKGFELLCNDSCVLSHVVTLRGIR
ncbi:hypothetical protein DSO57_1008367 [Entomophthora muscae]|uniref:Uncharacterized protein n=1 Tax=Entomophthora muscae TaxID=34485 RepID=A0ACC2RY47_9FUNG|nr:hypothetical protein DSO57_1008367 [Entomophthora muscae]